MIVFVEEINVKIKVFMNFNFKSFVVLKEEINLIWWLNFFIISNDDSYENRENLV